MDAGLKLRNDGAIGLREWGRQSGNMSDQNTHELVLRLILVENVLVVNCIACEACVAVTFMNESCEFVSASVLSQLGIPLVF
jgi:hypothetical protein